NQIKSNDYADILFSVFLIGADWRVTFASYPDFHWSALIRGLELSWTLAVELSFYLIAPFVLNSFPRSLALLFASCLVRSVLVSQYGFDPRWTYMFSPGVIVFFMIGHFARIIYDSYLWRWERYN